jgi:adenosylhomocysteine nucleosidase
LVSADRDLLPADLLILRSQYAAVAGDWESGAIAYVAARNRIPTLILRGVTDLVTDEGGEAYGNIDLFHQASREIMRGLIAALPAWLRAADF